MTNWAITDLSLKDGLTKTLEHLNKDNMNAEAFSGRGLIFDLGGQIIGIGGTIDDGNSTDEIWSMDKCTGDTRKIGNLPVALRDLSGTLTRSGTVWVTGGAQANDKSDNDSSITKVHI